MGRVLSIDYGERRIGLAVSDENRIIAQNLKTLKYKELEEIVKEIVNIIKSLSIEKVIVGNPLGLSGSPTEESKKVAEFIEFLKKKIEIEIELVDERFSTKLAERIVRLSGKKPSHKKGLTDKIAASIILRDYLDSER